MDLIQPLADAVAKRMQELHDHSVAARVWMHDPTLWVKDPAAQAEVQARLGWLHSIEDARTRLDGYLSFAKQIHDEGIDRVLIIGMGGSSLTAEVLSSLLAGQTSKPNSALPFLTSPTRSRLPRRQKDFPPEKSLYIIASKSGGTAEILAFDLLLGT